MHIVILMHLTDFHVESKPYSFWKSCLQISFGISMCISCAALLADLLLYSYEAELFKNLYLNKKIPAVAFNSTSKDIDEVLSINNCYFHSYVDSIDPSELEIKDARSLMPFDEQ